MATSFHKVNNNAASVLASAIDDNDLALSVSAGDGAEFDSVLQYLTLGRDDTYAGEIVEASSRSTDAFTLTARAQDGTTATAHDAGARVECLLVAAHITELQDAINNIENGSTTLAKVVTSGTAPNTHTIADSATNTVVSALELYHMTSGTPAAGLGVKLILGAENSNGDATVAAELHGYLATVTDGAEYGEALLRVIYNGTVKTVAKFTGRSDGSVVFYDTPLVLDTVAAGTGACWFICGPAGTNRHWGRMFTGNNQTTGKRWDMYANDTAESGSNAGTDFRLGAYADDGTWIDDPIQIPRVAGGAFTTPRPIVSTSTIKASSSSVGDITMGLQTTNLHIIEQYSGDSASGAFIAIKGRGTKSSPSTVQAFDGLFFLGARNYNESTTNIAAIRLLAGETYSGSGRGTYFTVETCLNGSTTRTVRIATDWITGHFIIKQGGSTDFVHVGGVVYENNTAVGNVGTGEDDLMSASVAASTLGTNGYSLRSVMTFSTAANGNNKTFKIKYGATTLWDSGAVAANAQMVWADIHIYRTGAATQKAIVKISTSGGFTATVVKTTPAETLSGAVTLKATGEATSDNDAVQESMIVWWEPVNT